MAIYTIADLHLSTLATTNKSMEVFGNRWTDYISRLKNNWINLVDESDTVVIPGDISWALSLEEAVSDLKFIDSLPGTKILGKGNHDFWWATMKKHTALFEKLNIKTIKFLFNNAHVAENLIIAGTRGWYHDESCENAPDNADFAKLTNREALRLKTSLNEALKLKQTNPNNEIVVFMHFPPFWNGKAAENMISILKEHNISKVYYGHIHGNYATSPTFEFDGIKMSIVSADYLRFIPKFVTID